MTLTTPRPYYVAALGVSLMLHGGIPLVAGIGLVGLSVYMED